MIVQETALKQHGDETIFPAKCGRNLEKEMWRAALSAAELACSTGMAHHCAAVVCACCWPVCLAGSLHGKAFAQIAALAACWP